MYYVWVIFNFSPMAKNSVAGLVVVGALSMGQANATPPENGKCAENQKATVTALR